MTAKPRFGEKILYKLSKTVKIGKSEARWRHGIWMGTIETSDEHLVGTDLGVIKCRAVAPLPESQRFDCKALLGIRGTPWRPSTRHAGWRIRTHIKADDDVEDQEEVEEDQEVEVAVPTDDDQDAQVDEVKKAQDLIFNRSGIKYNFTIKIKDVYKYLPTDGCNGCKFVTGEITYQCGHNTTCKKRMMDLMEDDIEDKHRVKTWYVEKGIKDKKVDIPPANLYTPGQASSSSATASNEAAPALDQQMDDSVPLIVPKRDRDAEQLTRSKKVRMDLKREREPRDTVEGDHEHSRKRLGCLNLVGRKVQSVPQFQEVVKEINEHHPLFVITSFSQSDPVKKDIHDSQCRSMKYFVHIDTQGSLCRSHITSNSAAVLAELQLRNLSAAESVAQIRSGVTGNQIACQQVEIRDRSANLPEEKVTIRAGIKEREIVDAINNGMRNQKKLDAANLFICSATNDMPIEEAIEEAHEGANRTHERSFDFDEEIAWDDVHDKELDLANVKEARKAEMDYFRQMKVYRKVPRQKCKDMTGKMPIKVRWIDTNKQDELNPKYRSRLVAKQFKRYQDPELYTATPPIEMLRSIISIGATGSSRKGRRRKIMVNDVARAYFNAPSLEPTFVEICDEDFEPGDEDMCGELLVSMYGTRQAASNWQKCYTNLLLGSGFTRTRASTCIFYHAGRDLDLIVHGDDFVTTGDQDDLTWLKEEFEKTFEISTTVIGHDEGDEKAAKVLNRIISVVDDGYTYEADARHVEHMINDLGLKDAKSVSSPTGEETGDTEELLEYDKFKKYQSICARGNFLAVDRMDIQFATKECCRAMSKPTERDWNKLKRLGRYLLGRKRLVYKYKFQEDQGSFTTYSDANWASNKTDRKSTSGGTIMHGLHYIKSWSKTQSLVALSSAESELYAIVKASSETLGLRTIFGDLNKKFTSTILSDASAALGIIQRQGLGKLRHIDCSYLFVQNLNAEKIIKFSKVLGTENPADLCTKGLSEAEIEKYIKMTQSAFHQGKHGLCPQLNTLTDRTGSSYF